MDYKEGAFAAVACASPQDTIEPLHDTWSLLPSKSTSAREKTSLHSDVEGRIWQRLTVQLHRVTHVTPLDQSSRNPAIENVKSSECLRARKVAYPWRGETHWRLRARVCCVRRTSARILAPINDMNPTAIADSGASHVILPTTALHDDKSAKQVNLRLAAGKIAVEA